MNCLVSQIFLLISNQIIGEEIALFDQFDPCERAVLW